MQKDLTNILDAVVRLCSPLAECVIHDLKTKKIIYINGSLSLRNVGDPSLIEEGLKSGLEKITYNKSSYDGRLIKSISVLIENEQMACLNFDVSLFNKLQGLSETLLSVDMNDGPENLFKSDWQEKIHRSITDFLQKNNLDFKKLNNIQKKQIINYLFNINAFAEKKAADYVAKIFSLSRATIFNYLKEWRNK